MQAPFSEKGKSTGRAGFEGRSKSPVSDELNGRGSKAFRRSCTSWSGPRGDAGRGGSAISFYADQQGTECGR